jgi:RHS repeat-associated protein
VAQRVNSAGTALSSDLYDAYGVGQSTGSPSDPWGYGAQWGYFTDRETGLLLLTHRYYDPSAGRFLNRDPIGLAGGVNLYGYAGNSPIASIDPLGLLTLPEDPSGLGPDWHRDPTHGRDGLGSDRWVQEEGRIGLEFDLGRPGAGGDQEEDHWHVLTPDPKRPGKWLRGKEHLPPGRTYRMRCLSGRRHARGPRLSPG